MGFLPGSLFEKLRPFLQSYEDCHNETLLGRHLAFDEMFCHPKHKTSDFGKRSMVGKIDGMYLPFDNPAIDLRYSGHARGITLSDTLVVIDEAQNFTPFEVKTILERIGRGSKAIVIGDPLQVDSAVTSRDINGFTGAIQHYLGMPYSALVKLERNYRHQISDDARRWRTFS
jgi:PhoH-like ATPase